jgi:triacylglycerol lipase
MSTLVEIAPNEYDPAAFEGFSPTAAGFKIANARALMWFSQLAYETHRIQTVQDVSQLWDFKSVLTFIKHKSSLKGSFETCGLIGEREDAVILAFAGTDPGIWQNLATDFTPLPRAGSDIHEGFRLAAAAAQSEIEQAIQLSQQPRKALFITGHSLGAALAALAAKLAFERGSPPSAVYAFGMPRVGGERFGPTYDSNLGELTYRLVHGIDFVARVPPSFAKFRHVGRALQCDAGAKFDDARPLSPIGADDPQFSEQLPNMFRRSVGNLLSGHILSPTGPGTFGPFFRFIPPEIRDHLQDSYWKALTP